jgi:stalled ribosome rescue protein Dom34
MLSLKELLRDAGIFVVEFRKKNGELRRLRGTISPDHIPAEHHPKGTNKTQNEDVQTVFDLDKQAWRSFRIDSVERIIVNSDEVYLFDNNG